MNNRGGIFSASLCGLLSVALFGTVFGQDSNPNRATSGNDDPTRGVRGENLRSANERLAPNPINQFPQSNGNPNRATSGNMDPARGVKGQNQMDVNSGLGPNPIRQSQGDEPNPNRATSGNLDPMRGVRGENLMNANTNGIPIRSGNNWSMQSSAAACPQPAKVVVPIAEKDRVHQIYLQIQGYGAFRDRDVRRKLNLTAEQQQTFARLDRDSARQLARSKSDYVNDGYSTNDAFEEFDRSFQTRVATVLTPSQNSQWQAMIGKPFGLDTAVDARARAVTHSAAQPVRK